MPDSISFQNVLNSSENGYARIMLSMCKALLILALLIAPFLATACKTTGGIFGGENLSSGDFVMSMTVTTKYHGTKHPAYGQTCQRAVTSKETKKELLAQGYALIGTVWGQHFAKRCDGSGACETSMKQADHLAALLDKAAQLGGERVIWTKHENKIRSQTKPGRCIEYEQIGYYEDYYDHYQKRNIRRYVRPCRLHDVKGHIASFKYDSHGLVFRFEPKLAEVMLRHENLFEAAEKGNLSLVKNIIKKGHDPNFSYARDADEPLPPLYAAMKGHQPKVAEYLLNNGVDVKKYKYLTMAVRNSDAEITKLLIQHSSDVNFDNAPVKDVRYWTRTPLHLAVEGPYWHRKSADIVKLLLEAGAEVNAGRRCRYTPLNKAENYLKHNSAWRPEDLTELKEIIRILKEAGGVSDHSPYSKCP